MVSKHHLVNTGVEHERVDVRKQGIEEIHTKSRPLLLIKQTGRVQISHGRSEDLDSHSKRILSSRLAISQSAIRS